MAPFMMEKQSGRNGVNIIRLVETLISGAIISGVVLYGLVMVLENDLGHFNKWMERMEISFEKHVENDRAATDTMMKWMREQQAIVATHNTVLKNNGSLK